MLWVLAVLLAYGIGLIPVGLWVSRVWGRDIRLYGSGNIGTSNALRVLGPAAGAITFIGDGLKGAAGVWVGFLVTGDLLGGALGGLAAICGQTYPVLPGIAGGKGVATSFGATLALSLPLGVTALMVWLLVLVLTRYISLSSMVSSVVAVIMVLIWQLPPELLLFCVLASGNIVLRHRSNIERLRAGQEFKIGQRV